MTKDIYLTSDLKAYYTDDFANNVLPCTDSFWGLPPEIVDILKTINNNPNVQTLYSHKKYFDRVDSGDSNITFTFTKDVELKIFREIIPYFVACFGLGDNSKFSYLFNYPVVKDKSSVKNVCNLASVVDGNYFNVNSLWFNLSSDTKEVHDKFWTDIQTKLEKLAP